MTSSLSRTSHVPQKKDPIVHLGQYRPGHLDGEDSGPNCSWLATGTVTVKVVSSFKNLKEKKRKKGTTLPAVHLLWRNSCIYYENNTRPCSNRTHAHTE